jgi:KTSC domain
MPSTSIEHIGYDESASELHVTFVGGGTYTYYWVPKQVYSAFRNAKSRGQFFNLYIKDRYDFRRHEHSA